MNPSEQEVPAGALAVDRALAVLELVAAAMPQGASLASLSESLQVGKASVFRIVKTLVQRAALTYDDAAEIYQLGPLLASLGYSYVNHLELRTLARPYLEELATASGETVHLGELAGREVVYVDLVDSPQPIRIFSQIGASAPAYVTSVGKAILSALTPSERASGMPLEFVRRTATTVGSAAALEIQFEQIRARGYSIDDRENREEIRSYAATVHDHTGAAVAAISVAGPVYRVSQDDDERLGGLVAATAREVSAALGYHQP